MVTNDPFTTANRLIRAGKYDEALPLLEPHRTELGVVFPLTQIYLGMRRLQEAEDLLNAFLDTAPPEKHAELCRRLSDVLEARGHTRKVAEARTLAAEAEALIPDPHERLGATLLRLAQSHDPLAALAAAEAALKTPLPPSLALLAQDVALAGAYNAERYDDAFFWATKVFGHSQADASVRVHCLKLKGMILAMQGNTGEALKRFEEATYLARAGSDWSSAVELTTLLCVLLIVLGRATDSIALAQEILARFPFGQGDAFAAIANAELIRGNFPAAQEALEQAEATHRRYPFVAANLAFALNDYEEALKLFKNAERTTGNLGAKRSARRPQVLCLWHLGKHDDAEQERIALAAEFSEKQTREEQASYWEFEATLAFLKEDWAASLAGWKQVLRLSPYPVTVAQAWVGIGDCYGKQGEAEAARFAWQKAAGISAESVWVRRANDRLELAP